MSFDNLFNEPDEPVVQTELTDDPSNSPNPTITDPESSDEPEDPGSEGDDNLSGIERYLSQFDIEGGIITFDDGSSIHFNELEPAKQLEILTELHEKNTKSVEDSYGLTQDEIGVINYLRENKTSFPDVVERLAEVKAAQMMSSTHNYSVDYDAMEDDIVYLTFLKNSNPEAEEPQLLEDLEKAKSMSNYKNIVNKTREAFKSEQQADILRLQNNRRAEMAQELESQRKQVVDAVVGMADIDGQLLDDTIKNTVLDVILSVDEDGDSNFMTEVFSDPEKLFKAAFWYNYGPDLMRQKEEYWKREKSAAFKRGAASVNPAMSFSSSNTTQRETTLVGGNRRDITFDDL